MNRDKEAVMLAKIIVGIAIFVLVAVYPPMLLVGILLWAAWTLWENYHERI
jgi:hypothetical protein